MAKKAKAAANTPELDKEQVAAKINEMLEKAKKAGSISVKDLTALYDDLHLEGEQIDKGTVADQIQKPNGNISDGDVFHQTGDGAVWMLIAKTAQPARQKTHGKNSLL